MARWVRIYIFHEPPVTLKANDKFNIAMGIVFIYQSAAAYALQWSALPYYSISLSLNVILTLMIIIRIILHARHARTAAGTTGTAGLYHSIITMLIESCALYSVSLLLVIGPWGAENPVTNFFLAVLPETQVRALPQSRSSDGLLI